jgi:hypothetical protein
MRYVVLLAALGAAIGVVLARGRHAPALAMAMSSAERTPGRRAAPPRPVPGSVPAAVPARVSAPLSSAPVSAPTPPPAPRRVSRFDEIRDGGFGVGSAAPIADGAQPMDHPVKAWRSSMTFLDEDDAGYAEADPQVWFYDAGAAERSGFTRAV